MFADEDIILTTLLDETDLGQVEDWIIADLVTSKKKTKKKKVSRDNHKKSNKNIIKTIEESRTPSKNSSNGSPVITKTKNYQDRDMEAASLDYYLEQLEKK